jgi:hypothetical protein
LDVVVREIILSIELLTLGLKERLLSLSIPISNILTILELYRNYLLEGTLLVDLVLGATLQLDEDALRLEER